MKKQNETRLNSLTWEKIYARRSPIRDKCDTNIWRAFIGDGWLIRIRQSFHYSDSWDWITEIMFIPDQKKEWVLEQEPTWKDGVMIKTGIELQSSQNARGGLDYIAFCRFSAFRGDVLFGFKGISSKDFYTVFIPETKKRNENE